MEKLKMGKNKINLPDHSWITVTEPLERFGRHLSGTNKLCKHISQLLQSPEGFKQHLLLRYCGATLSHYSRFLSEVRREYVLARESLMDPRYSILRPTILKEITADAYIYKEFHDVALDLTDPVLGLISILESVFPASNTCRELRSSIAELHCQCSNITKTTARFSSRLDHNLKYLDVSRNMQESLRVWILSALASVFLPLSIATGLLSMQSRFIDLQVLLYDFCGVVVLVATVLIVSFQLLRTYVLLKERFETWTPGSFLLEGMKSLWRGSAVVVSICVWLLILASFLVGMIKDVRLGAEILGFGLAALLGIFTLFAMAAGLAMGAWKWWLAY
jgi:hypothetical protein